MKKTDANSQVSRWQRLGQLAQGVILGLLLIPALLELAALAGSISAFKYQGF